MVSSAQSVLPQTLRPVQWYARSISFTSCDEFGSHFSCLYISSEDGPSTTPALQKPPGQAAAAAPAQPQTQADNQPRASAVALTQLKDVAIDLTKNEFSIADNIADVIYRQVCVLLWVENVRYCCVWLTVVPCVLLSSCWCGAACRSVRCCRFSTHF